MGAQNDNTCIFESMRYHILNGDALATGFPVQEIPGEVIVIREAFMDGPVSTRYDDDYWETREKYIQEEYNEIPSVYAHKVMPEFEKLQQIDSTDEVYLWFEDDLFCQCNMWFAVDYILQYSQPKMYRVFPKADVLNWMGFGRAAADDLLDYFQNALALEPEDILHLRSLWKAFVFADQEELKRLSYSPCQAIRFQNEVIQAQLDRMQDHPGTRRPYRTLSMLKKERDLTFYELFEKFSRQEGIYGFGDTQVRNMLKEV
jgi:hypothetical protein